MRPAAGSVVIEKGATRHRGLGDRGHDQFGIALLGRGMVVHVALTPDTGTDGRTDRGILVPHRVGKPWDTKSGFTAIKNAVDGDPARDQRTQRCGA